MKQLLLVAVPIAIGIGGTSLMAQDLAPGINYSYNPPAADGIITDISVDVLNNDNTSAGSFEVAMYLYDQATTNYWIIGTTNVPSLSGNSLITISNWDIDINNTSGIPAGTYRLGVWVDSNEDISEADENDNAALLSGNINYSPANGIGDHAIEAASVNCFPNPAGNATTLSFNLTESSDVTIEVFDALGNRVEKISNGQLAPGLHTQVISTENYADGIYFVSIASGEIVITRRLAVVH